MEVKAETSEERRMLPLKHQQSAFKSVYLKAQEGMKLPVRPAAAGRGLFVVSSCCAVVLMSLRPGGLFSAERLAGRPGGRVL